MSNGNDPKKIITRGLATIATQKLNDEQKGYSTTRNTWDGQHECTITPNQDKTLLPSGNDPAWAEIRGPVICDVELKIYAIPIEKMQELLSVEYSETDGVSFSSDADSVFVGMDIIVDAQSTAGRSKRKTTLYKVSFDLPEISAKSVAEGDVAVADLTLKGKAYPVFYTKADGKQGDKTLTIIDSTKQSTAWTARENTIIFPTAATTTPTETA